MVWEFVLGFVREFAMHVSTAHKASWYNLLFNVSELCARMNHVLFRARKKCVLEQKYKRILRSFLKPLYTVIFNLSHLWQEITHLHHCSPDPTTIICLRIYACIQYISTYIFASKVFTVQICYKLLKRTSLTRSQISDQKCLLFVYIY
jgi:hypothetical protein